MDALFDYINKLQEGENRSVLDALNVNFAITSDPQYPWPRDDRDKSREYIEQQYNSINEYAKTTDTRTNIFINGDITEYGHGWQWDTMNDIFKTLKIPYFYVLGNHDIQNNRGDCFQLEDILANDGCFQRSMGYYVNYLDELKNKYRTSNNIYVDYEKYRGTFRTNYQGSFAYALDWGRVYAIHINNFPTMDTYSRCSCNDFYMIEENMDWLQERLAYAKRNHKLIIINMHMPDNWKNEGDDQSKPSERFKELLRDHNVSAVFAGHYHYSLGQQNSYREYFGDVPVFLSGSADQKTYLIAEYNASIRKLAIYRVRNNDFNNKEFITEVEGNNPVPPPPPQIRLIENGDFASGQLTPWVSLLQGNYNIIRSDILEKNVLQIKYNGISQKVVLKKSTNYRLSAVARTENNEVSENMDSGTSIGIYVNNENVFKKVHKSGNFHNIEMTFRTGDIQEAQVFMMNVFNGNPDLNKAEFTNIVLEELS